MRSVRWARIGLAASLLVAVGACGAGGGDAGDDAAPAAPTTASAAPATSTDAPATTRAPERTTVAPTTTAAPATTALVALPVPAPVPDPETREPVLQVGHVSIPKIGVSMPMFEGVTDRTLDLGPGHWPGTALPGQLGNVVVAGHRVSEHGVFRHVDHLAAGDEIIISNAFGVPATYVVTGSQIVEPDAMWIVDQQRAHTATLFACHPPGSTRQRIVVHATLKEPV
jgi:sortase A